MARRSFLIIHKKLRCRMRFFFLVRLETAGYCSGRLAKP
jgi:hypothetical protein